MVAALLSQVGDSIPGGRVTSTITEIVVSIGIIVGAWQAWSVRRQVKPNGGSSLADTVNRLETKLNDLNVHASRSDERLDRIELVLMGTNHPSAYQPPPTHATPHLRPVRVVSDLSNRTDPPSSPSPAPRLEEGQR